ncbi:MAG: hypothetical protein US11_C0002G0030 [Candidatus Roizmanbacteria bacterium GW2011_GWA2_36_23]|uniref:Glycosyltransferase RgtA/B/C/D-like domain-containing protein n=1 Tax=Candidatus Roizmanbacteria bacterium GW2011_GWA2_36_23 TaxID=1618480 RepID=A0A0G0HDF2_9BACT|nr:MAG: hypothetical protein US11_C0002G0030 [Candidatus Roizmanbacteria bacterium GW2011_GWA2_36_23]
MEKEKKIRFLIISLFILFFLVRLPFLDQLFLLHDERDIVLSGYSIAKTGKDLYGNSLPLSFNNISPNAPPLSIYFSSFWSLVNPIKSVFYARLPFVIFSSLLIFLIYQLIYSLTKNRHKAILTSVFYCFSPWMLHLTRLAFDSNIGIVFVVAAIILYLRRNNILAYFFFFLSFYTYQGLRLLLPVLIIYLELFFLWKDKDKWQFVKKTGFNIAFVLLLIVSGFMIDSQIIESRKNEIIFFNKQKTASEVIFQRMTSVAPDKIKEIFSNKPIVALDYILTNFIKGQDISYLFKEGDYSAINGTTASGQFFLVFIVLYYLGMVSLGRKATKEDLFIIGFSAIGMVTSLLSTNGVSFSTRSPISGIGFAYLIAQGSIFSWTNLQRIKQRSLIVAGFIALLILNIIYFSYTYFYRRPVTVGELFNEHERQLVSYLANHTEGMFKVYTNSPKDIYLSVIFLDNNRLDMGDVQKKLAKGSPYIWHNYSFEQCIHTIDYLKLKRAIISEGCLTPALYEQLNDLNNTQIKERIKYKDYSTKTAYFITR